MPANPFVIERGQAPMQGLRMLAPSMQRRGERALERSKQKQYMKLREDVARIMDTGTPEEIAEFVTKNPGAKAVIDETINFKSEATKRSLVEGAKRRLMGEVDPAESWLDHADLVDREGGNAAQSINAAKGAMQDPKSSEDDDLKILAMYDKPSFDNVMKMRGKTTGVKKQKTGAFLVRDPKGKTQIVAGVFDPGTGKMRVEGGELPAGYDIVSKLGETGIEESKRKVEQARETAAVKGEEVRASSLIERGIAAAESTATTRRAIDLLESVKTGGFDQAKYTAKRLFGIESADEGELSNSLGKSVLSQLRETFGAAFTESEGKRLERIEASFGKSPEANKRLLTQVLRIAERTAKRARKAAQKRGDTDTVADIDDLLTFTLSEPEAWAVKKADEMSDEELERLSRGGE